MIETAHLKVVETLKSALIDIQVRDVFVEDDTRLHVDGVELLLQNEVATNKMISVSVIVTPTKVSPTTWRSPAALAKPVNRSVETYYQLLLNRRRMRQDLQDEMRKESWRSC